ncbi:putative Secreted Protein (CpLSP family) [Cryptosporidium felis]|nr:putative Secreted Protein (CpLSP family) [Cryptosporidium felis]
MYRAKLVQILKMNGSLNLRKNLPLVFNVFLACWLLLNLNKVQLVSTSNKSAQGVKFNPRFSTKKGISKSESSTFIHSVTIPLVVSQRKNSLNSKNGIFPGPNNSFPSIDFIQGTQSLPLLPTSPVFGGPEMFRFKLGGSDIHSEVQKSQTSVQGAPSTSSDSEKPSALSNLERNGIVQGSPSEIESSLSLPISPSQPSVPPPPPLPTAPSRSSISSPPLSKVHSPKEDQNQKSKSMPPEDAERQNSFIQDLLKIKLVSDLDPATFRKNMQQYEYKFGLSKAPTSKTYKMTIPPQTRESFRAEQEKALEKKSSTQKEESPRDSQDEEVEILPLPSGPPIPGTEPGIEGLSHFTSFEKIPLRPQRRQDEWDCVVSQVERDKITWKVEKGRMRYNYIPKFSDLEQSLFLLSGDAKTLYQNCVTTLRILEEKSVITPPSSDEVEAEFLRATFCISASVYCYAESALGDPELQLYWNREVRLITDSLIARDPNLDLLQVVGESLSSKSGMVPGHGLTTQSRLPEFMPQRMPNASFSFASTTLETCPMARSKKSQRTDLEYEGGLEAILAVQTNQIVVDDPELWTMWKAIITQRDRDLHMNLKRFSVFSRDFPAKFSSSSKPKKLSELRNVCVELIREGIRENPPRYELLPMAKPNEEQVLNEFCNYAADYYFGNRQWNRIFETSSKSLMVFGLPAFRPYAPFRYFAGETFDEMRINCCSVIYDLFLSKVFPHISTSRLREKATSLDKGKLERFCHMAATSYFGKELSSSESKLKDIDYFDFRSFRSRVTNYKKANYQYISPDGMFDLEDNPGHFSIGSLDGNLGYTPRFPNLKATRVSKLQWKAILDQNREDLENNVETPTHLPEEIPEEWNMPQFSRATFRIACLRIIRKLYREGSVSIRSNDLSPNNRDYNMERILSDFCQEASKRYFDGLKSKYSLEQQFQIQTDTESQWNLVVESIMKQQDGNKSGVIYWVYPIPPESYILSKSRYNVNPEEKDEEEEEEERLRKRLRRRLWGPESGESGFETRCLEALRFYLVNNGDELPKMEVSTEDSALVELAMRQVCSEAADNFFGAVEWLRLFRLSNPGKVQNGISWVPAVTGLPKERPKSPILKYNGAGSILQFRNYCFAFVWTLWKAGTEPELRISGKLYSGNEDLGEMKAQLERWCTHAANEAYNSGYGLSEEEKQQQGVEDLRPRMDPQTSLSAIEHEKASESEEAQRAEGETVIFSFGDASSQWKMVLAQMEADRRCNIRRIIWLPQYPEVKELFPGPVERRHFVRACIQILRALSDKGLLEWGVVSPEYQGVVLREFCSDTFVNGYDRRDDASNPISAPYGEREANREMLIEFLRYMHENKMNVRKWVLFYLNKNTNLEYALSWALNEGNWSYLADYLHQAQLHEPDNFSQLFEEVRERVREMGGFVDGGGDEYFSDSPTARENLWRAIYSQIHIDILLGRNQRVSNLPINPPAVWLGSKKPEDFVSDCKRVISILQGQSNPEKQESKEQTLREILTAVRIFSTQDKDETQVLDSFCKDVFLHVSGKPGHSVFKGSGFQYPGAILEFERNRQWGVIANLERRYSKLEQRDLDGGLGAISRIHNIPGFVRHTLFQGSYEMEEFQTQCEIALEALASDVNIPSHQRVVFPDLRPEERIGDVIKDYCGKAAIYVFQESADLALDEDLADEVATLNDLDGVSRRFKLRNPLGLDFQKRWSSIVDLARKRIDEEKYLKMNRVLKIDSRWLKNSYPEVAGPDLKNAFDSKENNHLASFVLVSYELFSAILLGKEGRNGADAERFQFTSRKTLLQFCRDVCYKYFTDEARGDIDYSDENKAATENALILDMIASRPRIGPDPRDPLFELYPEKGEEVPELNSFNMDQYITSRWEIYKKDFENDQLRENLRKNILDSLNAAEANLLGSGKPRFEGHGDSQKVVWAPKADYPWKHHTAAKTLPGGFVLHTPQGGTVLARETLERMKAIFGGNVADIAKTTTIPRIPGSASGGNAGDTVPNSEEREANKGSRILPLADFGGGSQVRKLNIGTKGTRKVSGRAGDQLQDKFDEAEKEYKELVSSGLIRGGGASADEKEELNIRRGVKPRGKLNPERLEKPSHRRSKSAERGSELEFSTQGTNATLPGEEGSPLSESELASQRLADREWTLISQLAKVLPAGEGGNLVIGIPLERPRDLYPSPMGNSRGMYEACLAVLSNSKFRAVSGTRISGRNKEDRRTNAAFYCRKASEILYESVEGEFIPPKVFESLPGFQNRNSPVGRSRVTRGSGSLIFLGESSENPMGKEIGLRPVHKEAARVRKTFGQAAGPARRVSPPRILGGPNLPSNNFPKFGETKNVIGALSTNIKTSSLRRSILVDSNRNLKEKVELIPGGDLLADPNYFKSAYNHEKKYVEIIPSKGLGSGAPKPGKSRPIRKDRRPPEGIVPPTVDDEEEGKVKRQLENRLRHFSKTQRLRNNKLRDS